MSKSKFDLYIKIIPLDFNIEKYICSKLDLSPYKSYSKMSEKEINHLFSKILNKFENTTVQIPKYFCKEIYFIKMIIRKKI